MKSPFVGNLFKDAVCPPININGDWPGVKNGYPLDEVAYKADQGGFPDTVSTVELGNGPGINDHPSAEGILTSDSLKPPNFMKR